MAKVLLSFLGAGPLKKKEDLVKDATTPENIGEAIRAYRKAKYSLEGKIYENRTFVASAIADHHKVDKIFMIGTPKSMWEEVYNTFYNRSRPVDKTLEQSEDKASEDIWFEIQEHSQATDHNSPLEVPHKEEIEKEMGGGSKVVLIKYGITEDEIRENITRILQLEQCLQPGDELIVDITHAFRSLPLLIMSLLVYLKNVSSKNIKISHIYYGMNEVSGEMGNVSPIVDLKTMLELQDWIIGAYSMKEYGNAYEIAGLLKTQVPESSCDKGIANQLEKFSDYVNLNYMDSMMKVIQSLSGIHGKCENEMAKLVVNPVIDDFLKKFKGKHFTDAAFLYRLSEWLFKNRKYAQSYLTALEAIISHSIELNGYVLKEEREINENGAKKSTKLKFLYTKEEEVWDSFAVRTAVPIVLQKNLWKNNKRITEEEYFQDNLTRLNKSPKSEKEKISLLSKLDDILDDNETLKKIYLTHNKHRNQVAHLITARSDGSTYSSNEIIKTLRNTLDALKKIIK